MFSRHLSESSASGRTTEKRNSLTEEVPDPVLKFAHCAGAAGHGFVEAHSAAPSARGNGELRSAQRRAGLDFHSGTALIHETTTRGRSLFEEILTSLLLRLLVPRVPYT